MKYLLTAEQTELLGLKIQKVLDAHKEDLNLDSEGSYVEDVVDYHQAMVSRLFKPLPDESMMLVHATMGISGEAGELLDAVKKHVFYEKPLDIENAIEELGDLLFYITAMANLMGIELSSLLAHNCCKLQLNDNARYKSGSYSNEQASGRADKVIPILPSVHLDK